MNYIKNMFYKDSKEEFIELDDINSKIRLLLDETNINITFEDKNLDELCVSHLSKLFDEYKQLSSFYCEMKKLVKK